METQLTNTDQQAPAACIDYNCPECEDRGFHLINDGIYTAYRPCRCTIPEHNKNTLARALLNVPLQVRNNLSFRMVDGVWVFHEFILKPEQAGVKIANRGWIHGATRFGKTHLVAEKIIRYARHAKKVIKIKWIEAKSFDELLLLQYGETHERREYNRIKDVISNLDILVLNDFDKLGKDKSLKISPFKSAEIKDFLDNVFPQIPVVIVTANNSPDQFCKMHADQDTAPQILSRLEDLFVDVGVGKY